MLTKPPADARVLAVATTRSRRRAWLSRMGHRSPVRRAPPSGRQLVAAPGDDDNARIQRNADAGHRIRRDRARARAARVRSGRRVRHDLRAARARRRTRPARSPKSSAPSLRSRAPARRPASSMASTSSSATSGSSHPRLVGIAGNRRTGSSPAAGFSDRPEPRPAPEARRLQMPMTSAMKLRNAGSSASRMWLALSSSTNRAPAIVLAISRPSESGATRSPLACRTSAGTCEPLQRARYVDVGKGKVQPQAHCRASASGAAAR